jgi:hypothetical protein
MRKITKGGKVYVEDTYVAPLEGSGEDIVKQLQAWSSEFGVPLHDIEYFSFNGDATVSYWRDMTPEEKAKDDLKKAKTADRSRKLKDAKEAKERKELQRLQKKYGTPAQ